MARVPTLDVQLRELTERDLPIFFEHQLDPAATQMAAFTSKDPSDREAFHAHWDKIRGDATIVIKTVTVAGTVAGYIAKFERADEPEVTYWIGRAYWGKGVATEALAKFLVLLPERPLFARAAADNTASLRVMEKCGFVIAGHDRGFANARGEEIEEAVLVLE